MPRSVAICDIGWPGQFEASGALAASLGAPDGRTLKAEDSATAVADAVRQVRSLCFALQTAAALNRLRPPVAEDSSKSFGAWGGVLGRRPSIAGE